MKSSGVLFTAKKRKPLLWFIITAVTMASLFLFAFHQTGFVSSPKSVADSPNSQNTVSIKNMQFNPGQITVTAGTTIAWTNNESGTPHTVTSDNDLWDSGVLQPGQSFSRTFSTPGTFTYHCNIHPFMHGTVIVTGATASPSPMMPMTQPSPFQMSPSMPPMQSQSQPMQQYTNTSAPMQTKPQPTPYFPTHMRIIRVLPSANMNQPMQMQHVMPPAPTITPSTTFQTSTNQTTNINTNTNNNVNQNFNQQTQSQTQNNTQYTIISQ